MSERELKRECKAFVKKATAIIERMQKSRDELRELVCDYNDILEQSEEGLREIESGIDTISGLI